MTEFDELSEEEQTDLRLGEYGKYRRRNPETALLDEVPFGEENRSVDQRKKDLVTKFDYGFENIVNDRKIYPPKPTDDDRSRIIKAKNGFHGYVDHPMHFLAGEAGRERIDIHKTKRKHHDDFWDVSEYFGGRY